QFRSSFPDASKKLGYQVLGSQLIRPFGDHPERPGRRHQIRNVTAKFGNYKVYHDRFIQFFRIQSRKSATLTTFPPQEGASDGVESNSVARAPGLSDFR